MPGLFFLDATKERFGGLPARPLGGHLIFQPVYLGAQLPDALFEIIHRKFRKILPKNVNGRPAQGFVIKQRHVSVSVSPP